MFITSIPTMSILLKERTRLRLGFISIDRTFREKWVATITILSIGSKNIKMRYTEIAGRRKPGFRN